jgi:hypothetical protein
VLIWLVASAFFAVYVANFGSYNNKRYGTLAGVMVFPIWLWLTNVAVLLGAGFNAKLLRARVIQAEGDPEPASFVEPRDTRKLTDGASSQAPHWAHSQLSRRSTSMAEATPSRPVSASTGELVSQLSDEVSTLIRDELRLAQAEITEKTKTAGIGAGLFGGTGLVALYGIAALVTAAILGLAVAVAPWFAAAIVGVVLLAIAGLMALSAKRNVSAAAPPVPEQAINELKANVQTCQGECIAMTDNPASTSPEHLRPELDEAREKLGETVDQLAAKLDVKVQAKERVGAVRSTISDKAAQAKNAAPPSVKHAMKQAGSAAAPAVDKAKQYNKQLLIAAAALVLLLIGVRRWRSS